MFHKTILTLYGKVFNKIISHVRKRLIKRNQETNISHTREAVKKLSHQYLGRGIDKEPPRGFTLNRV